MGGQALSTLLYQNCTRNIAFMQHLDHHDENLKLFCMGQLEVKQSNMSHAPSLSPTEQVAEVQEGTGHL